MYAKFLSEVKEFIESHNGECNGCRLQVFMAGELTAYDGLSIRVDNVAANYKLKHLFEHWYGKNLDEMFTNLTEEAIKELQENSELFSQLKKFDKTKVLELVYPAIMPAKNVSANDAQLDFGCLKVVFKMDINLNATTAVTNVMMKSFRISMEELRESAFKNLASQEVVLLKLLKAVEYRTGVHMDDEQQRYDESGAPQLYCLFRKTNYDYGAGLLMSPDHLYKIAQQLDDDLVILPSSIHELIVARASEVRAQEMLWIVKAVNSECLDEFDFLTDDVFIFSREDKLVRSIKEGILKVA